MNGYSNNMRHWLTAFAVAALTIIGLMLPAFDQPENFHHWVDQRSLGPIPNAADVLSNLGFLLVGAAGLYTLSNRRAFIQAQTERFLWYVFFSGLIGIAFGSAYYHWHPTDATLMWDRAAMVITFCGLFCALVSERISARTGLIILPLLLLYALVSLFYWYAGRLEGAGDLRPYAMLQAALFILIPWLLWLYPARYSHSYLYLLALASYGLALISEHLDEAIFIATGVISGHTLKHLLGALAGVWLVLMLVRRSSAEDQLRTR